MESLIDRGMERGLGAGSKDIYIPINIYNETKRRKPDSCKHGELGKYAEVVDKVSDTRSPSG